MSLRLNRRDHQLLQGMKIAVEDDPSYAADKDQYIEQLEAENQQKDKVIRRQDEMMRRMRVTILQNRGFTFEQECKFVFITAVCLSPFWVYGLYKLFN